QYIFTKFKCVCPALTTVRDWLAQETQQSKVMQVIGVRLVLSSRGLDIILETPDSKKLLTTSKSEGNNLYVVIPNTWYSVLCDRLNR
ncbi:MAG: hypothetical protein PUP92_38295, partial [Rhizonema sp. PD38]|nr:hypothetical protein [Rhizonema sp. PD38]